MPDMLSMAVAPLEAHLAAESCRSETIGRAGASAFSASA